MKKRAIIIVIDSMGIGAMPDCEEFGDTKECNTLRNVCAFNNGLDVPVLEAMGLGNIQDFKGIKKTATPIAQYGTLQEKSKGKDTTTGHWEIAGLVSEKPFSTFPNGFPKEVLFFADKSKRILSVYGRAGDKEKFEHLKDYPFTGFSGKLGPKLKRGDRQIPEGIYGIEYLNPNSTFHLSLKVSYPGDFDVKKALADGRKAEELGGDIMIHGRSGTVGCIPIGDDAVEEVFIIAAKAGIHNIKVIISPCNLLSGEKNFAKDVGVPWYGELIENIRTERLKDKALCVGF